MNPRHAVNGLTRPAEAGNRRIGADVPQCYERDCHARLHVKSVARNPSAVAHGAEFRDRHNRRVAAKIEGRCALLFQTVRRNVYRPRYPSLMRRPVIAPFKPRHNSVAVSAPTDIN